MGGACPPEIPMENGQPVRTEVRVSILHIGKIDVIEGTFEMKAFIHYYWRDPNPEGEWTPKPMISNAVSSDLFIEEGEKRLVDEEKMLWRAEFHATGKLQHAMCLRNFPFDHAELCIQVDTMQADQSVEVLSLRPLELFKCDETFAHPVGFASWFNPMTQMCEWQITGIIMEVAAVEYDTKFPQLRVVCEIQRYVTYYVVKVVVPLTATCMFLAATVFMKLEEDFIDRMGYIATLFLATSAFIYIVSTDLPRVAYLTLMDKCIMLCFFMIFGIGIETVILRGLLTANVLEESMVDVVDQRSNMIIWSMVASAILLLVLPAAVRHQLRWRGVPATAKELEDGMRITMVP